VDIDYDFDGSLHLADVVRDFFHSPSTGLYVYRHPLTVDERVLRAADELGMTLSASPEKWVVNLELADALRLLERLGSTALSLPQYFQARRDAQAHAKTSGDAGALLSLEPDSYIEMLATVFLNDRAVIHHPRVNPSGTPRFEGEATPVSTPVGRYGWVHPDDIDLVTGLPTRVSFARDIEDQTLKYWDTHTSIGREGVLMAVRGYVTSVGKISVDLGFPAEAISHKLTVRECKATHPDGVLAEEVLEAGRRVIALYDAALADKSLFARLPAWLPDYLELVRAHGEAVREVDDLPSRVLEENLWDGLGALGSAARALGEVALADEIAVVARAFSKVEAKDLQDAPFLEFLRTRRQAMNDAVTARGSIVFVIGHDNPDTDTVVAAMAEAFRQHLLHGERSTFVPVVPGHRVPDETEELIGHDVAGDLVRTDDADYQTAAGTGRPEWIMVDHSLGKEQSDTRAIIDHHFPSEIALVQQIPRRIVFAGSTCGLVAQKLYGLGLEIPPRLASFLHGTALMDTENRLPGKMTALDELVMNRLKTASGMADERAFYQRLMRKLITTYDADALFVRDYKEDWSFGFAVAKGIGILDAAHDEVVARLLELARASNAAKNLPLTLVKVVSYADDAVTIARERLFPVYHQTPTAEFARAVKDVIVTVIRHESPPGVRIEEKGGAIEYSGVGTQLSRKKLTPVLDPVVKAFNRYFYSPSTGLHFLRDFLRPSPEIVAAAAAHGLKLHVDERGVVVGNPGELKLYLQECGFLAASPRQYFRAYFDAHEARDVRMVAHLTSGTYLETLDALVLDKQTLVEHPRMVVGPKGLSFEGGERRSVTVPVGEPGLIDPRSIDLATGLPTRVEDPRQYGKGLWRYWSPTSDRAWVLRSTIFAYDIPSLDLKFDFAEALPRLSIRPCVTTVKPPSVQIRPQGNKIKVEIQV